MSRAKCKRFIAMGLSLVLVLTSAFTGNRMTVRAEDPVNVSRGDYHVDTGSGDTIYVANGDSALTFGTIDIPEDFHFIVDNVEVTATSITMASGAYLEVLGSGTLTVGTITATEATEEDSGSHLYLDSCANKPSCVTELYDISAYDGTTDSLVNIAGDSEWSGFDFEYLVDGEISGWGTDPSGDDEGDGEDNQEAPNYQVEYDEFPDADNNPQASVKAGNDVIPAYESQEFTAETPIVFTLVPPSARNEATPIVEIEVFDGDEDTGNTVYRSDSLDDSSITITNNAFTYTPRTASFVVRVWWSEYDAFGYDDANQFQIIVDPNESCDISVAAGYVESYTGDYGEKYNYAKDKTVSVTFAPHENCALDEIYINDTCCRNSDYYEDEPLFTTTADGTYTYTFTNDDIYNASEDRYNSVFVSAATRDISDAGGEGGEGEGDENQDDISQYTAAKAAIESADIAYYATDATTMKYYLAAHLWDGFFDDGASSHHTAAYSGMFADTSAITAALTISDATTTTGSVVPNKAGTGYLPYYTFEIKLYDDDTDESKDITASGKVYVLESATYVVAKFTSGSTVTYDTEDCSVSALDGNVVFTGAYSMSGDNPQVEFFGNAAEPVGTWDSGREEYLYAGHMTQEHFPTAAARLNSSISASIIVIQPSCTAIKVSGNGANGTSAAWGWSNLSWYATNGTTSASPMEFDVYVGDTVLSISSNTEMASSKTITSVACTLTNASKAVSITGESGTFHVTPLSNFYNSIPLTITYSDGTKAYIKFNRVALTLNSGLPADGSSDITISHGTDNFASYEANGNYTIYGSFYYPTNKTAEANGRVNLEVTYTWANGSVTRATISPANASVITNANQGTTHVDDFILWNGAEANRPVKVEAIAVVAGSDSATFKGALIGAGAGVTWTR